LVCLVAGCSSGDDGAEGPSGYESDAAYYQRLYDEAEAEWIADNGHEPTTCERAAIMVEVVGAPHRDPVVDLGDMREPFDVLCEEYLSEVEADCVAMTPDYSRTACCYEDTPIDSHPGETIPRCAPVAP
jgi:hypothetical protein